MSKVFDENEVWPALSPFMRRKFRLLMASVRKEDLQTLKGLIEAGRVRPVIARTYPSSEVPEAIRSWERGPPLNCGVGRRA